MPSPTEYQTGFWQCPRSVKGWDLLDYIMVAIEWIGMIPSLLAFILLCQLDGLTRTSLLMLRTVIICAFLTLLTNFVDDITPYPVHTENHEFNRFMCAVWTGRFLYWIFSIIGAHALIYFATYRTMQIAENLQLSFAASRNIDLIYVVGLTIYSVLITIPEVFYSKYDGISCKCVEQFEGPWVLEFIYAQVYVFFCQLFVINSILLIICSRKVIKWVKDTSKKSFYDTLNALHFKDDTEEVVQTYEKECGWSTSSMCVVPMTFSYAIAFSFDTTYKLISAIDLTTYEKFGTYQKVAQMFLLIHPAAVPFIILYYIPALRFWVFRQWNRIVASFDGRRKRQDVKQF